MSAARISRTVRVVAACVLQLLLVGIAVAPSLSARVAGEEYLLEVAPLDPIDPFRGAYVTLDYPDLQRDRGSQDGGPLYITLVEQGGVMVADAYLRDRPSGEVPYLSCNDRDWRVECGIDSFFLPQDEAAAMESVLRDGAIAEVKIDGRGHAALIDVHAP